MNQKKLFLLSIKTKQNKNYNDIQIGYLTLVIFGIWKYEI